MTETTHVQPLKALVGSPWRRFLEDIEPHRPELYRYCRYLTRSPWDAEDLVQEALARAFVTLALVGGETIDSPRAWLFRVAYNVWLNQVRRAKAQTAASADLGSPSVSEPAPRDTREAAGLVLSQLAPQERAALVLKDVFDFKLEEVAEALSTSVGAVKAALHRGRGKLAEPEPELGSAPHPALLDAFADAFNRRDLDGLTALLLESVTVEFPGLHVEYGAETARNQSLRGVLQGNPAGDHGGIPPALRGDLLPTPPRLEARDHRGEVVFLCWFEHASGPAVRALAKVDVDGERVSRIRTYLHHPDLLAEVCRELAVPFRPNGYRFWW